jgi:eukaryotic-like serine/threonine-protein kinase
MHRRDPRQTRRKLAMATAPTIRSSPFGREQTIDVDGSVQARLMARAQRGAGPPLAPRGPGAPAQRVGKYEVVRRIARGRITEILLGRAEGIGGVERQVVLKLLKLQLAHGGRFVRSFLHEERVTSALNHPNVVQLLDSGHDECGYYMVLEYIRGWNLGEIVRAASRAGQRVPVSVAATIIHGVAAGLHHLHELLRQSGEQARVSHRDVQPGNIMIGEGGAIKLIDFGDVAIEGMEREKLAILSTMSCYTPPEALSGESPDRRGDIYSLGAVFYELTTGVAPRLVEGAGAGSPRIRPPSSLVPDYVPELDELIMRMLQPEPERRLQSMASVQFALEEFAAKYRFSLLPRHMVQHVKGLFEIRQQQQPMARNPATRARAAAERSEAADQRRHDSYDDLSKTRIRLRSPRHTPA